jgi:hypothetical protein
VVERPGDLGRAEIGVEQQPGFRLDRIFVPRRAQLGAAIGGAPVLPDDRARQRFAA